MEAIKKPAGAGQEQEQCSYEDTTSIPMVSLFAACSKPHEHLGNLTLDEFLDNVKTGVYKSYQDKARQLQGKEYKIFKSNGVPAVTIHGTCTYRRNEGFNPNGIVCLEADGVTDPDKLVDRLSRDPYTFAAGKSIGGGGVWWLVSIADVTQFNEYHTSLRGYFLEKYGVDAKADEGAKSLSNFRVVCYDPDLYRNDKAMTWKNLPTYMPKNGKKKHLLKENNHRTNILSHISAKMAVGLSDDEVMASLTGVHLHPESCCNDPKEIDKIVAYVRPNYHPNAEKNGVDVLQYCGFWTNNFKSTDIQLSLGLLTEVLTAIGYRILEGEYLWINKKVVYKKTKAELYEAIINLVSYQDVTFNNKDIKFTIDRTTLKTKAQKELRGNINILALPSLSEKFLRDTATETYFHYKNRSIRITNEGKVPFDRSNADGVIWAEQIIPHDLLEPDDSTGCHFLTFVENIAGDKNLLSFLTALGSRLRNYNSSEGMKAIWLCDENYEIGKNLGRLGKSIVAKAIGKVRKMDDCSGKDFNPENQFKFQNMDRSTQVYVIDDVKSNFDFRSMYNYCTEGAEFSKKHRDRIKLSLQETPQLVITSNYPPKIEEGSSTTGRLHVLPCKDFYLKYADDGGVKAYHGHVFFDDWDAGEWNRFFWFMAECAQLFLLHGLKQSDMSEIRKSRFKSVCAAKLKDNDLANEMADWIYCFDFPKVFPLEVPLSAFRAAVNDAEIDKQVFAGCLKTYFDLEGIAFTKTRDREGGKQITNWRLK